MVMERLDVQAGEEERMMRMPLRGCVVGQREIPVQRAGDRVLLDG